MTELKHIHDLLASLAALADDPNARNNPDFDAKLEGKLLALRKYLHAYNMHDLLKAMPDFPLSSPKLKSFLEVLNNFIIPEASRRFSAKSNGPQWEHLHPRVVGAAKRRFENGHLADAVEAAFKEMNATVKVLVFKQTGQELDGARLMTRAFAVENPILQLADLTSESGRSEQIGYMQIFAGSMTGIRNPKAHANIVIDERRAIHLLYLASLLMFKIDHCVPDIRLPQNPPLHRTADATGEGE